MGEEKNLQINEKSLLSQNNSIMENYKFTEDKELNDFLNIKLAQFTVFKRKTEILLGAFFTEIFEKLSSGKRSNQYNSIYKNFLEKINMNQRTALRLRKRYALYNEVSLDLREIIANMSVLEIELLSTNKELFEKFKEGKIDQNEIKVLIESKKTLKVEKLEGLSFFGENLDDQFLNIATDLQAFYDKENKTEKDNKKLEKIGEYLIKIKQLLDAEAK